MPIDPRRYAMTAEGRTAERLADLERRAGRIDASSLNRVTALAQISRSTDFAASTANQAFPFTDVDFDTAGMRDASTPTLLTIPSDGVYLVAGTATWNSVSTGGLRAASLRLNGVAGPGGVLVPADLSSITKVTPVAVRMCEAGDEITMNVQHGDTITVTMQGGFSTLSVIYLGPLAT